MSVKKLSLEIKRHPGFILLPKLLMLMKIRMVERSQWGARKVLLRLLLEDVFSIRNCIFLTVGLVTINIEVDYIIMLM